MTLITRSGNSIGTSTSIQQSGILDLSSRSSIITTTENDMADHQHGPNCNHGPQGHDHGHSHGPMGPMGGGPGGPMQIQVDPAMQALMDALPSRHIPYSLVDIVIPGSQPPQTQNMVVCAEHKNPVCDVCDVNFTPLNYMQQFMKNAPPEAVPPPPNVQPPPQRAEQIKQVKEAGNVRIRGWRAAFLCPMSYGAENIS